MLIRSKSIVLSPSRQVVNYANNSQRAKDLVDELHKLPSNDERNESPRFECIQADVGDKAALDRMVKDVVDRFGRLDVVVSNAGWTRITNFMNLDEAMVDEDWEKCFLYNVKAHLWLFHAAKPELEKNSGAFITTASLAGIKPSGSSLAYSVTKAALIHLSKGLATIAAPNVRVNAMSPGLMLTEWGMQFAEEKREAARKASKLQRLPSIEVLTFMPSTYVSY